MYGKDTSEAVQELKAQCDQLVIDLYLRALTEVPWPPATTTSCYLYLSSELPGYLKGSFGYRTYLIALLWNLLAFGEC